MEMLYGNDFQKVYQEGKIVGEVFLEFLYILNVGVFSCCQEMHSQGIQGGIRCEGDEEPR